MSSKGSSQKSIEKRSNQLQLQEAWLKPFIHAPSVNPLVVVFKDIVELGSTTFEVNMDASSMPCISE